MSGAFHPVLSFNIGTVTEADRETIESALTAFEQANPEINLRLDDFNGQLRLLGEDELLLEGACLQILPKHLLQTGELQILYRETIRKPAEAEGKYIRQTDGKGNYGHCWLRIEPGERDSGYEFVNLTSSTLIPMEYVHAIDRGVQLTLKQGILADFPLVDLRVTLTDGSYHDLDSNGMAFLLAGATAAKQATKQALPVVLEPVMAVEAQIPEDLLGAAERDIRARRGRIVNIDEQNGSGTIHALVPLAELLRSSKRGRPRYAMRFAGYEVIPGIDGDEAAVYATRPIRPAPRSGSAAADPEF